MTIVEIFKFSFFEVIKTFMIIEAISGLENFVPVDTLYAVIFSIVLQA